MKSIVKSNFLNAPIIRIIFGLVLCFVAFIIAQQLVSKILDLTTINKDFRNLIKGISASFFVLLTYLYFYRRYEKRDVLELTSKGLLKKNVGFGVLIGTGLQTLTIIVIYLLADIQLTSINPASFIITPFAIALSVAIFEEILLRGIVFRITEERLGSCTALLLSALIFGAAHLINPDSSIISAICTAVVGFVLGAAYIFSRSLWMPIAIHFSWNFMQSGIFGVITSGNDKTGGLFNLNIVGSEYVTGGAYGPEGTIQAVLLWLIVAILFAILITKQNKLIKPFRKKDSLSV